MGVFHVSTMGLYAQLGVRGRNCKVMGLSQFLLQEMIISYIRLVMTKIFLL